ncbi:MAG: hypothetical protein RL220_953 [Bacteroidota bacterium]
MNWITYGLELILSFCIAWFLLQKVKSLGTNKGSTGQLRWSSQKVPTLGGLVLFLSFLLAMAFHRENVSFVIMAIPAFFAAFITGLWDDMRSISPRLKLIGQLLASVLMLVCSDISLLSLNAVLLVFLMIALMNSLNMLDNMDGVAAAIVLMFCAWNIAAGDVWPSLFIVPGLLVFLFFNLRPAKMYLGDGGSLFLGLFIGYVGIGFVSEGRWGELHLDVQLISTLCLLFCLPAADTLLVVINRLMAGISPAVGGRDHSTHHLVYAGVREEFIPWLYSIVYSSPWIMFSVFNFPIVSSLIYFVLVFAALFLISRRNISQRKFVYPS